VNRSLDNYMWQLQEQIKAKDAEIAELKKLNHIAVFQKLLTESETDPLMLETLRPYFERFVVALEKDKPC
jgi:hypothetical protein